MTQLNDFYRSRFGWICRQCERELAATEHDPQQRSRLMREGEAESRAPRFSTAALAKWADPAHRILECPRCGITELADKS